MKRFFCILLVMVALFSLASCVTRVPDSETAIARLEKMGCTVEANYLSDYQLDRYACGQVVMLSAEKEGEFVLQAYFFQNEEDTKHFYEDRRSSLAKGMECVREFKYSIWRGDRDVIDDLLS